MAEKNDPPAQGDDLPEFPNWEIPPKPRHTPDLGEAYDEWLRDWRERAAKGLAKQRSTPVDEEFKM